MAAFSLLGYKFDLRTWGQKGKKTTMHYNSDDGCYDIDLFRENDLTPLYAHLREKVPVAKFRDGKGDRIWVLSRYADVVSALKNTDVFSSSAYKEMLQPEGMKKECLRDLFILSQDEPEHKKNRGLMNQAFSPRTIEELCPFIRETASTIADNIKPQQTALFADLFAYPFVATVIDHAAGVNDGLSQEEMDTWLHAINVGISDTLDTEQIQHIEAIVLNQNKKFKDTIEKKKNNLSEDLLSNLVNAREEGSQLSTSELLNAVELLYIGGLHAQIQLLCHAILFLSHNAEILAKLKAAPELVPDFVEELLRYETLSPGLIRKTTQDITLHDVTIPAGETVLCLIGAANRDTAVFPDPDVFDITRPNLKKQVAFGYGPHLCLGATLARYQISIGIQAILSKFNTIKCPKPDEVKISNYWNFRSLLNLKATFS